VNESIGGSSTEILNDGLFGVTQTRDVADYSEETPPASLRREGLPQGFRMRHDAHYVEELISGGRERANEREPRKVPVAAAVTHEPAIVAPAPASVEPSPRSGFMFDLLASRMETVVAHAGIEAQHSTLSFIARSIQAELSRVSRLARAAALLHQPDTAQRHSVVARDLATTCRHVCAAATRPGGLGCDVAVDDPDFTLAGDGLVIVRCVSSTVDAFVDLLLSDPVSRRAIDNDWRARISIGLKGVKLRPALIVTVACPILFVDDRQARRFFDNNDDDFRAAAAAGILLAAAARGAQAHGGRAEVECEAGSGTTVTYVFPKSTAGDDLP
jgi:hypothetical protein